MDFLQTLQQSAFAKWVSESGSLLGYPTILFLHTIGLAMVAGLNAGLNLRLLGFAPGVPLAPLGRLFPAMWLGFAVTAASGLACSWRIGHQLSQVIFYVKLLFGALAVVNMQMLWTRVFRDCRRHSGARCRKRTYPRADLAVLRARGHDVRRLIAYITDHESGTRTPAAESRASVGTAIAIALLILALVRKNDEIKASLRILLVVALLTIPAYLGGVSAEKQSRIVTAFP